MNKKEILEILKKYDIDKDAVILSGASMVVNGIKDKTYDIDLSVSKKYNDELLKKYKCDLKEKHENYSVYKIDNIIEFGTGLNNYDYDIKYGYKFQKPEEILKLKQILNREKDKEDIKLLKDFINKQNINSLSLAYLGDAVYELYIREYLLTKNLKVNDLQQEAIKYVSANSQSAFLDKMIQDNFLSRNELAIVKRARNHKSHSSKSTDIITYKKSTGLEALIGYLKVINDNDRILEIMNYIVGD